jgi:hypothetical protein
VITDGQSKPIHLIVITDNTLKKSIMSRVKANLTGAIETSISQMVLTDDTGQTYTSKACIDLTWYSPMSARSSRETFCIVEDCEGNDAILRAGCRELLDVSIGSTCHIAGPKAEKTGSIGDPPQTEIACAYFTEC